MCCMELVPLWPVIYTCIHIPIYHVHKLVTFLQWAPNTHWWLLHSYFQICHSELLSLRRDFWACINIRLHLHSIYFVWNFLGGRWSSLLFVPSHQKWILHIKYPWKFATMCHPQLDRDVRRFYRDSERFPLFLQPQSTISPHTLSALVNWFVVGWAKGCLCLYFSIDEQKTRAKVIWGYCKWKCNQSRNFKHCS